ncbi:MAG: hypothetical protein ACRDCE_18355 [Cetobacterium sp.]|uniref:hypothetical protein n=1 Tax=Cetobacterium sp. TaxID=2071632 RepID=UPI003EE553A2
MKKLILGLGVLTGVIAVANEAKMDIKAEIIKPLKIVAENSIDFGKVVQGSSASSNSKFSVNGEANNKVNIIFKNAISEGESYAVYLKNTTGDSLEVLFSATDMNSNLQVSGQNYITRLDTTGNLGIHISGTVSSREDQQEGAYSGDITLAARYN